MSFLLPFLIAFGSSLLLVPLTINLAKKYGFVDDPKKRAHPAILHRRAIVRAGGLPVFLAFVIAILASVTFTKQILGIFLGGFILVTVGILDDKYDLKNYWRLIAQIVAAIIVVGSGVGISFITNPLYSLGLGGLNTPSVIRLDTLRIFFDFFGSHSIIVWADILAIFWIVWVINMVNFSSGVDGQMPGIVLISLLVILAVSLRFLPGDATQLVVGQLAIAGVGTTLAFLLYNFYPAKIFPGDSASYFLGFLVAVCAILSGAKIGAAVLVMAVPLIDGVFTIVRRVASGKSPLVGDRKHLHHRLLELGWGQRRIALFYYFVCAILGAIALLLHPAQKIFAGVLVAVAILGGLIWLNMNLPIRDQK